ncbi:hypothetical protein E4631_17045 [Hymenobacter sp. UV11]|uniref:hypothetical protein n=1 Tax=Hymenobacter sp. UV11 TaxID=1849735 RepID=UPI00105B27E6|nr:hypothetical protein [Hymenobacter sp. UV11]TDN38559.1 hypothetical protein A8B98_23355 [Hymenobacter sp. UV11]TFZ65236.1 hypothetical protein E4631_17045 [Hymenobacter sp. UV11]
MVHSFLPVPFADAARQQLFAAVHAALLAEPSAPTTVLLGNLGAFTSIKADALLVRPGGAVLVVLTPRGGRLTMPALAYGAWQLDGLPLPDRADADNPFEQYRQQRPAALAWLNSQPGHDFFDLQGIALFAGPLTFGPEVESHLHQHLAADFQLAGGATSLPIRLRAQEATPADELPEAALLAWADQLAADLSTDSEPNAYLSVNYLEQKLRQLWRWLGAEDIPDDPPYGGEPTDPADQQEHARLQQLRHELQAELSQQRQEAAAREATRTQELAQLRQQLAQVGLSATERRAEQQATAALEEDLRTARAELAARNQELDTRIQQLGRVIIQLQAADKPMPVPVSAPAPPALATAIEQRPIPKGPAFRAANSPTPSFRRLRQAERWGIASLVLVGVGMGTWGAARLMLPHQARPASPAAQHRNRVFQPQEAPEPNVVYVVDSTLAAPAQPDTTTSSSVGAEPAENGRPAFTPAKQSADSATTPTAPTSAAPIPANVPDSIATPSPTP